MRNYMIFLGVVALIGFAAGAAQAEPYAQAVLSFPSAHEESLERSKKQEALREKHQGRNTITREVRGKPSGAYPIPSSDGYRMSNPLGSVYCGVNGCWR